MYNINNNNQIIRNNQNYFLKRKLLTIHSEDRDISSWPNSNNFEITLPESLTNIESMRIVESNFPSNYYTFSNSYKNTKLSFRLICNGAIRNLEITIQEGFYTPTQLATELTNKINTLLIDYPKFNKFNIYYDIVGQKFYFGSTNSFILTFANPWLNYDDSCESTKIFSNYCNWGLPYNLGFNKEDYYAIYIVTGLNFDYNDTPLWTDEDGNTITYYVSAPFTSKLLGDSNIYMEVDKYNSYDELTPYIENTNNLCGGISEKGRVNPYNGKVKSAFAKIPILTNQPNSQFFDSRNNYTQNLTTFIPPIEKLSKLKFKFRFHDGRLVDFNNNPFDFTIEFNTLLNEIKKSYNVRVPSTYLL